MRPQPGMEQGCGTHEWDKKVSEWKRRKISSLSDELSQKVLYNISSFEGKAFFNILPFVPVIEALFLTHLFILAAFLLIVE